MNTAGSTSEETPSSFAPELAVDPGTLQSLLMDIALTFIGLPSSDVSENIDGSLARLGRFFAADRVYVFEYDYERGLAVNTHEWCAPGIEPQIAQLQGVPLEAVPEWVAAHAEGAPIHIPDVAAHPAGNLKNLLAEQGIKSLLTVPMMEGAKCSGFVGFDSVREHHAYAGDELQMLRVFAGMLLLARGRERAEREKGALQAHLAQAQKMESVGRLAGGVAHDSNNMLQAMLANTELALGAMPGEHPARPYVLEVQACARRSADLTSRLLAFARKQSVVPTVLDVNAAVENVLDMLRRLIGPGISLAFTPGDSLGAVCIDRSQLDQILVNLCVNARDAIDGGGAITIATRNVAVERVDFAEHAGFVPGEYVVLSVGDDGSGIDAETRRHLFEPFFTTKALGKGTGLGLAVVYGIVKQHDGFIDLESEPGRGSTFKIYLPRHAAPVSRASRPPAEAPRAAGETILLVEDEPVVRMAIGTMLKALGYVVLTAASADEALRLAEGHDEPIALVLTDVVMPGMNGIELSRRLAAVRPGIKRLLMSGYSDGAVGGIDGGARFLQKPFTMNDLAAELKALLSSPLGVPRGSGTAPGSAER